MSPSKEINFSKTECWSQCQKKFERYVIVSDLSTQADTKKINILLYIMAEESKDIMLHFSMVPQTHKTTLEAFKKHFVSNKNVIFERFKFNFRIQKSGKSIDCFITALHSLAKSCDYGILKEKFIWNKIVVEMFDSKRNKAIQLKES